MQKRIRKVKDGWRITGGLFKSQGEMIEFATNILRAVNGQNVLKEKVPKGYSNLGPQGKAVPSPHAGRGDEKG